MKKPKLNSIEAVSARRMRANEARRYDLEQINRIVAALDPKSANYQSPKRMAQGKMLAMRATPNLTEEGVAKVRADAAAVMAPKVDAVVRDMVETANKEAFK